MNQRTIAETLYHYGKYDKLNLYENAKFRKMFDSTINMTMAGGYTVQLGDSWLWYGRTDKSHGHWDMLSMGIDAYGFNFTPDLGYPDATLFSGKKYQWVQNTLSHNTVVVDGDWQKSVLSGRPLHFDDSGERQHYEIFNVFRFSL